MVLLSHSHVAWTWALIQLDDDLSGEVTLDEWVKAMQELGLQAPADAIGAVFESFDKNASGSIEYEELHKLLIRSVQRHPRLEPLAMSASNAIATRAQPVKKKDANLLRGELAGVGSDTNLEETLPNQIRAVLHKRMTRVIDLFRQLVRARPKPEAATSPGYPPRLN